MPRTEAGKRLLQWFKSEVYNPGMSYDPDDFGEDVDAIEAEAREKGIRDVIDRVESDIRAAIIQKIKTLPVFVLPTGTYVDIEDVYDILGEDE